MELINTHPLRNPQILSRREGDGMVLVRGQDTVYNLNPTASTIWMNCTGQNSVEAIVQVLFDEYDVDRDVLKCDIIQHLGFFAQEKLISL